MSNDPSEVTESMISAGVEQFLQWDESDDYSLPRLVEAIYCAMLAAGLRSARDEQK